MNTPAPFEITDHQDGKIASNGKMHVVIHPDAHADGVVVMRRRTRSVSSTGPVSHEWCVVKFPDGKRIMITDDNEVIIALKDVWPS